MRIFIKLSKNKAGVPLLPSGKPKDSWQAAWAVSPKTGFPFNSELLPQLNKSKILKGFSLKSNDQRLIAKLSGCSSMVERWPVDYQRSVYLLLNPSILHSHRAHPVMLDM